MCKFIVPAAYLANYILIYIYALSQNFCDLLFILFTSEWFTLAKRSNPRTILEFLIFCFIKVKLNNLESQLYILF